MNAPAKLGRTGARLSLAVVSLIFCAALGCGGSSGGGDDDLDADENSDRVGTTIVRCGVDELDESQVMAIDQLIVNTAQTRAPALSRDPGTVLVPVVAHVITTGSSLADGNVPDDVIAQQIAVLNSGFNGGQGGVTTPFTFALAGITRTVNPAWHTMELGSFEEREAKQALRQGGPETLNVYLASPPSGTLGWAYFPWDFMNDPVLDGVVISFQTVPGGSLPPYNEGDTLVHEVGHWLGLFHSFQGGCGSLNDDIGDTPAENRPAFGCPVARDTCSGGGPDPINNYMDYSDDFCLTEFSPEQIGRMDLLAATFRGL